MTDLPIERVLFTEEQVEARVREVAAEISLRYQGRDLKLIGVLKGIDFLSDRPGAPYSVPAKFDLLAISSFANQKTQPRRSPNLEGSGRQYEGEDVILVEDIVDTGFTPRWPDLRQHLSPTRVMRQRDGKRTHRE